MIDLFFRSTQLHGMMCCRRCELPPKLDHARCNNVGSTLQPFSLSRQVEEFELVHFLSAAANPLLLFDREDGYFISPELYSSVPKRKPVSLPCKRDDSAPYTDQGYVSASVCVFHV